MLCLFTNFEGNSIRMWLFGGVRLLYSRNYYVSAD